MQHWPLATMLKNFPRVEHYRQLVTVRNPYHRAVCEFNYQAAGNRRRKGGRYDSIYADGDVNAAIKTGALWACHWPWHAAQQSWYVGPNTDIIKFEDLPEAWDREFPDVPLPHTQKWPKAARFEDLTQESMDAIARKYSRDFILLGYEK